MQALDGIQSAQIDIAKAPLYYSEIDLSRLHRVFRRYTRARSVEPVEDYRSAMLAICERKRDKDRTRALGNAMFIQSIIYAGELRSEHFTFIRADARETPPVYLSVLI